MTSKFKLYLKPGGNYTAEIVSEFLDDHKCSFIAACTDQGYITISGEIDPQKIKLSQYPWIGEIKPIS